MSDKKTPEERAIEYGRTFVSPLGYQADYAAGLGYLAGQADFTKHRLPKLLEMAREMVPDDVCDIEVFKYTISDILAMAEKGEV